MTALREQVFQHVTASHRPISAYDLIESLAKEGKRRAEVSVYRILDVLQAAGIVHRLESRNSFFACMTAHDGGRRRYVPVRLLGVCERGRGARGVPRHRRGFESGRFSGPGHHCRGERVAGCRERSTPC